MELRDLTSFYESDKGKMGTFKTLLDTPYRLLSKIAPIGSLTIKLINLTGWKLRFLGCHCTHMGTFGTVDQNCKMWNNYDPDDWYKDNCDLKAGCMMTFFGRKGSELSPLPSSGVAVWKMEDEGYERFGGTKCHLYLAWRSTTGSLAFGPNVISIGLIPGARESLQINSNLMHKMLFGTESFFLRIPPEGDPGSGADIRSISTHQLKLTGLVSQRSKEGPRWFARARTEVSLETRYSLPKTMDDKGGHEIYLVAWADKSVIENEDKAVDQFGISVGVMVAFKMSGGTTYKVAEPKIAHPRPGTCEPPFWPVLEDRYVASRCFSIAEEARISGGKTRYVWLCRTDLDLVDLCYASQNNPCNDHKYQPGLVDSRIWSQHLLEAMGIAESVAKMEIAKLCQFMKKEYVT